MGGSWDDPVPFAEKFAALRGRLEGQFAEGREFEERLKLILAGVE